MFFSPTVPLEKITKWMAEQVSAVHPIAKNGIDIEIKPHSHPRSNAQNRFLMVIMTAIVKFYQETGYMPQGCQAWMMRTDIQKEYWKARFGIVSTKKLDIVAFTQFIDNIQRELVQDTQGEWEIIKTDSAYLKSLMQDAGI